MDVILTLKQLRSLACQLVGGGMPAGVDPVFNLRRELRETQQRAGVSPIGTLRDFRRTFCTRVASIGPMHVLKELAGHANIETTASFYLNTSKDDAKRARRNARTPRFRTRPGRGA